MAQPIRGRLIYSVWCGVDLPPDVALESRLRLAGHLLALWTNLDLDLCYWALADFCHGCADPAGRSDPEFCRLVRKALETSGLDPASGEPFNHPPTKRLPAGHWPLPRDWIARRAYYLWEQRGRPWGQADRNWLDAEFDVKLLYPALCSQTRVGAA